MLGLRGTGRWRGGGVLVVRGQCLVGRGVHWLMVGGEHRWGGGGMGLAVFETLGSRFCGVPHFPGCYCSICYLNNLHYHFPRNYIIRLVTVVVIIINHKIIVAVSKVVIAC